MAESKENEYMEKVGKQSFIVGLRPSQDAKLTHEELVNRLLYKTSRRLEDENA